MKVDGVLCFAIFWNYVLRSPRNCQGVTMVLKRNYLEARYVAWVFFTTPTASIWVISTLYLLDVPFYLQRIKMIF